MANKPMKSITLPGLEDTYTFLQNDTTLSIEGAAADAKTTGDAISIMQTKVDTAEDTVDTLEGTVSTLEGTVSTLGTKVDTVEDKVDAVEDGLEAIVNSEVAVSGNTPVVVADKGKHYICGTVASLSFTPSHSGICSVRFTSGVSATSLTVPSTIQWPSWFDPSSLETNTIYELNIQNGLYGVVGKWGPIVDYGGIPVFLDNARFARANGTASDVVADPDWFIAGWADSGSSTTKAYTYFRSAATSETVEQQGAWRTFDDKSGTSVDWWAASTGSSASTPTINSSGQYILFSVYKPDAHKFFLKQGDTYLLKANDIVAQ